MVKKGLIYCNNCKKRIVHDDVYQPTSKLEFHFHTRTRHGHNCYDRFWDAYINRKLGRDVDRRSHQTEPDREPDLIDQLRAERRRGRSVISGFTPTPRPMTEGEYMAGVRRLRGSDGNTTVSWTESTSSTDYPVPSFATRGQSVPPMQSPPTNNTPEEPYYSTYNNMGVDPAVMMRVEDLLRQGEGGGQDRPIETVHTMRGLASLIDDEPIS